jgi:hypothetical protein
MLNRRLSSDIFTTPNEKEPGDSERFRSLLQRWLDVRSMKPKMFVAHNLPFPADFLHEI